jgi:hypothetical protein
VGGGRGRAGSSADIAIVRDSVVRITDSLRARLGRAQADSAHEVRIVAESGGFGIVRRGGAGGRGGFAGPTFGVADSTGSYLLGFRRVIDGSIANLNEAAGLQDPGNGESGIQGLKSTSLTMGETYFYPPGQLAANQPLRVIVVHLAPGTRWNGR